MCVPRAHAAKASPFEIVIIDVTDQDIDRFGRFPWTRDVLAHALKRLNQAGVKGVFFDYIFSESDTRWPERDQAFANAIAASRAPVFLAYALTPTGGASRFDYQTVTLQTSNDFVPRSSYSLVLAPLRSLAENATGTGSVNILWKDDELLRDLDVAFGFQRRVYPAISVVIAAHYLGVSEDALGVSSSWLTFGDMKVKLKKGRIRPDFPRPYTRYAHYSYSVLFDGMSDILLKDKFVIMGVNATGVCDHVATQSSYRFPGPEVHAVMIEYLMENAK